MSLGSSNTEYVNARVRARRAALFADEDYRKLIRMGPSGIARFMEESEYEREINELGTRFSGVDLIEYALNRNLAKHFRDLLEWSEGRVADLIGRYLRKFDVWNLKTIIRGIYTDAPAEDIRTDLVRAGELDDATIDRLLEADEIEDAIELLDGTIYYEPLREGYEEFEESDILVPLENALDREFYENLLADLGRPSEGPEAKYVEFLQAEIDFRNASNALRLARTGTDLDPATYYIEGGVLFEKSELNRLVTDYDDLIDHIAENKRYGNRLSGALNRLRDADSLIQFEHALDAALLEYADTLSSIYPVSVSGVLSYILAKEREVENIRAIARGREVGFDENEIEEELVIL
ncbi:V-type ATP synthase subunit C [Natronobacterium gregoryi]|uniref:A-type ATP synthase subunit C n=2 Tax=Natronobacterium gregoryi TaxID=44930 RepID=L0AH95_NATGS|nr:V-type ATP synthase subunit C [Natronobacterium gregoryi]AFZ73161.1 ATP synthase A1, C subunit [Natronobacterium gregoryi SP2]ELY71113.1 V-type ATP synthase subunit C [Natronobacterium gregoryi SP2]PLK21572.1 V-type ATP synthase subunit C [Natronobacterium gregoryi SP2]SFI59853.1 V/A-type H+-transporting ATPase subunit C [Natronobacterium gregoryi]